MLKIVNDKNELTIAIGGEGSVARSREQFPALIEKLNTIFEKGGGDNALTRKEASQAIEETKKTFPELNSISVLKASHFQGIKIF